MSGSSDDDGNAWDAVSIVLRIATVGFSLASAIMTFASTQCVYRNDGSPAGTVSYSDYGSFKYSALASVASAALQGMAIWLEVLGKKEWAKTVEFVDKLVLALTSTSAPLLFAVDNITSCGPPRSSARSNGGLDPSKRIRSTFRKAAGPGAASLICTIVINVVNNKLSERDKKTRSCSALLRIAGIPPGDVPPPLPSPSASTQQPPPPPPPTCSCSCPTVATPCCCDCDNHQGPCRASSC